MMTRLPATFAEADMVDTVGHWVELVGEAMTAEAARTTLRNYIRGMLRRGTIPTMRVIAAAEAGHQDADMALREVAAEYIDRRVVMPTVSYPPGRNLADTWLRDVCVAVLVHLVVERWHLRATRNRASERHSACSVVALALV